MISESDTESDKIRVLHGNHGVHMKNAYIVDFQNAEAIADAIEFMKENKDTAMKLASQARKDALEMYSLKTKVDRHIELYRSFESTLDVS
jgi:glycosyltransferase involved in cell wall biosynthesis